MKLCMMIPPAVDRRWILAQQMGVTRAIAKLAPELTGLPPPWDDAALAAQVARYRAGGFEIVGLEGDQFDMSRIKLGLPGRDADIELYRRMLANMGRQGIRLLCLNFMVGVGWWRTERGRPARGGAHVTAFDAAQVPEVSQVIGADDVWANLTYFLRAVAPAAEAAGVQLGLHPDDPPVPTLLGHARVLTSTEALLRAAALADNPAVGITFCQGSIATMGEDVAAAARRIGRDRIAFVHVRDIRGTAARFAETFPDEGQTDMAAVFRTYADLGLACFVRPDHAPAMEGDPPPPDEVEGINAGYEAVGMTYTAGYLRGLLEAQGWGREGRAGTAG